MTGKRAAKVLEDMEESEVQGLTDVDTSVKDQIVEDRPSITSPEWNDYVISQFTEDELVRGMPVAGGLRRVAEKLLGLIVSSLPVQVFPATDGSYRATVVWRVEFGNGLIVGDVADVNDDNTDDKFLPYATATAATRAEARALRKALRLKTVAFEEITEKDTAALARRSVPASKKPTDGEYKEEARMTDPQGNFLDAKCSQLNIDVAKFFKKEFDIDVNRKITKQQASTAIDRYQFYQQNQSDIPEEIKGYQKNWRSSQ